MQFAGFTLRNNLFVAPMAGVTDRPFRQLCKKMGAGWPSPKWSPPTRCSTAAPRRCAGPTTIGEVAPISVQIAGADPAMMAEAARHNVDNGAQIIDINMGCPAKKVCNVMAGSALMQDETLVGRILDAVVGAVPDTPVTLKFRTGWNLANRNAPTIARIAESAGIRAVAIHGRTRASNTPARPSTTPFRRSRP
jgi:tRNA-dihydrouridine synthase B